VAEDGVRYDEKSLKVIRGTEARTIAKVQADGWELVDQQVGTVRSTLSFRKPKPPLPVRQLLIGGAVALTLATVIGVGVILEQTGNEGVAASAPPTPQTPAAEPSAADVRPKVTAEPADPPVRPSRAPSPADLQPSAPPVVAPEQAVGPPMDTTVDELLDRLNSADMGGIALGDQFRFTGTLVAPEYWGVGASGDYFVFLVAQGGANDLQVFVDQADAAGWGDGTTVEMVVESVEVTINGETTDGWLRALSVRQVERP